MSNYIIAIDPDLKKSGVAIIDKDGEIVKLESMGLPVLIGVIDRYKGAIYAIEDVNKHGTVYRHNRKGGQAVQARIAQNIGMVKAAGSMIAELIEDTTGRPPILAPLGIGKQVKRSAKLFRELTGWQGRTNEDMRDAASIGRWVAAELKRGWTVDEKTGQLVGSVKSKK
jgi:hypothetical protein